MCYFCRIYKKAQTVKKMSLTAFHKDYKVSLSTTTYKIERFVKGVWGLSSQVSKLLSVLVTVDCICNSWHVYPHLMFSPHRFNGNVNLITSDVEAEILVQRCCVRLTVFTTITTIILMSCI